MAYDKEQYDAVQNMKLGDLVHFMLTEYVRPQGEDQNSYLQSTAYFWACERLNELTPDESGRDEVPEGWQAVQP